MEKPEIIKFMLGSGAVSGVIVSTFNFLLNKKLKHKEAQLRILDRIVDKQIIAYDNILNLVTITRFTSIYPEKVDLNIEFSQFDYPLRFICILNDKEAYNEYWAKFVETTQENSRWLDIKLIRELYFMQDYLINLNSLFEEVKLEDDKIRRIGIIVKQDFIDIASEMERLCFKFFNNGVTKIKFKNKNKWHKYPRRVTEAKFQATNLFKHIDKIRKIGEFS